MWKNIFLFGFGLLLTNQVSSWWLKENKKPLNSLSDHYIGKINSKKMTWKARQNFHPDTSLDDIKALSGTFLLDDYMESSLIKSGDTIQSKQSIPKQFDARERWPECELIKEIRNQGKYGTCWAKSVASVISDRICISSSGKSQPRISSHDLISCCKDCTIESCTTGGFVEKAFKFFNENGLVTGGPYGSNGTCKPYEFPPANYKVDPTVCDCKKECKEDSKTYAEDKYFGWPMVKISNDVVATQKEIMKNGPVVAAMVTYSDFHIYDTGVYQHSDMETIIFSPHAVKIIGWGEEDGIPYWLAANSWGDGWGELKGFFKILRGANECNIEKDIMFANPKGEWDNYENKPIKNYENKPIKNNEL